MSKAERDFFNALAITGEYDVFPDAFYREIFWKIKMEHLRPGSMIIDVGSGSGAWSIRIAKRGYVVVGIDMSSKMTRNAHRFANNHQTSFSGICGDAGKLPFRDNNFDCVFFGFSLHHIPNVLQALEEAYRCLKSGGFIILIEPNGSNPVRKLSTVIGKLLNRTRRWCFSSQSERPLSMNLIYKLLKACKFDDISAVMDYTILKSEKANVATDLRDHLLEIATKLLPKQCGAVNFIIKAKRIVLNDNICCL